MNFLIDILINLLKENSYIIICIFAVLLVYFIISEIKWQKTKFKDFIDVKEIKNLPTKPESGCYVFLIYDKKMEKLDKSYKHVYVGQSVDLLKRIKTHLSGNGCKYIYKDYKYGKYVYVKLIKRHVGSLDRTEKYLIRKYKAFYSKKGYNKTRGGGGYYGKGVKGVIRKAVRK